ncbi:transporter suffix domain-containing protein [Cupriavidus sp. WKF15]|uniref:transporter suffix domain-containing protein n=1 Tax=Cupriavidus sp. WKF15 TaxID=3032282 RepID=UPI0023E1ED31|nr:transporter suffix domain-containing protein [Cupriavidus sp. WKF15]WER50585.1 transporter suffix domain-containing protein [Cupriavidus sp. WKF15]WER50761.1 transporter suffix domain-containing protein [Cupriavidus sp. WKF15]
MADPYTQAGSLASATWRLRAGIGLLVLAYGAWLAVPVAATAGASPTQVATLTGAIVVANKIMLLASVAVMGKPGFMRVKAIVLRYLRRAASGDPIGPVRHALGLAMFCLPLLSAMLEPYVDAIWPDLRPKLWEAQLLGDVMLVASVFVLGGEFWNKVRALFIRTARVVDDGDPTGGA